MKRSLPLYGFVLVVVMVFGACSDAEQKKVEAMAEDTKTAEKIIDDSNISVEVQSVQYRSLVFNAEESPDSILEAYRNEIFQEKVIGFFGSIVNSNDLSALILKEAEARNISPSVVFALSWEESRFNQRAINRNVNNSIDRGLFQLNSSSFPKLKEADFFDPETNTRNAMAHLRWCLDYANSEVAGLAMYNAGSNRVRNGGTPKKTLDYVSRILRNSNRIEELFLDEMSLWIAEIEAAQAAAEAEYLAKLEEPNPIAFVPVDSLALAWAGILSTAP
jgi:hypothetical protein